jgi:hypothetical protein
VCSSDLNLKVFFDVLAEVGNYRKITVSNQRHLSLIVPRPLPVIPAHAGIQRGP